MRIDPASARAEADTYLEQAVLALRQAFSSDVEIKEEMYNAVDRVLRQMKDVGGSCGHGHPLITFPGIRILVRGREVCNTGEHL